MTPHYHFGEQLRNERKKQGLTVLTISSTCGTSRSYITLIETGRRLPGKKLIPRIATALNLKTVVVLNWYLADISHQIHLESNPEIEFRAISSYAPTL